jgi:hypothetical protein
MVVVFVTFAAFLSFAAYVGLLWAPCGRGLRSGCPLALRQV